MASNACDCEPGHSCAERDHLRAVLNRRFAEWRRSATVQTWQAYDAAREAMADHLNAATGLHATDRMASNTPIKAISLIQPWATLVAIGAKSIETRSWKTDYTGPLAIHAAKRWGREEIELCFQEPFRQVLAEAGITKPADLPLGAIIAVAWVLDCVPTERAFDNFSAHHIPFERAFGNYLPGRFAIRLANVKALPEPIPCRGALGLWDIPADIVTQIMEAADATND